MAVLDVRERFDRAYQSPQSSDEEGFGVMESLKH
jgi:hypothetical protein